MIDGVGNINQHQPALQQTQTVRQQPTTDTAQAQDPNSGNRTRELLGDAVQQHIIDEATERDEFYEAARQDGIVEAAKRDERGQNLNIIV